MGGVILLAVLCGPVCADGDDAGTLATARFRALEPGEEGSAAIAHVLADYQRRGDGEGGFAWWMKLPIAVRSRQASHSEARYWRNRIEFLRDAQRKDAVSCAISGAPVLADDRLGCDYAAELDRYLECTSGLPQARREPLLTDLKKRAISRLDDDVARCPMAAASIEAVVARLGRQDP